MKVIKIADKALTSQSWTVEDALESLLSEIKEGKISPNHCMLLWFNIDSETTEIGAHFAGTDILAYRIGLLELAKDRMLKDQ